jgi:hypothetical protein
MSGAKHFTFVADASVPELGMDPDDCLTFVPGDVVPLMLHRDIAFNFAALRDAIDRGQLRLTRDDARHRVALEKVLPRYRRLELVKGQRGRTYGC